MPDRSLRAVGVTIDSVLVRDKGLATADLDGQIVVLSTQAGAYFSLNEVAGEIWQLLAEPCEVGAIFDALSRDHDVDAVTLSRDVLPFLQSLIDRRLAKTLDKQVDKQVDRRADRDAAR
jgi:hypothetical protein